MRDLEQKGGAGSGNKHFAKQMREYWDNCADPFNLCIGDAGNHPVRMLAAAKEYSDPATAFARGHLPCPPARVLEAGCGMGLGLQQLSSDGYEMTAIDISRRRCIASGRNSPESKIICGDAVALPFAGGSFDAVYARDIMMYMDREMFLAECRRVLRPGGRIIIIESLRSAPWVRAYRRLSQSRVHRALSSYIDLQHLKEDLPGLECRLVRPFYLIGGGAFWFLFNGCPGLYRAVLALTAGIDHLLLKNRKMQAWAWRAVALYVKTGS